MSAGTISWSKSSLDNLLHGCRHQWYLKKVEKLEDPGTPMTAAGTAHHSAIELHELERIAARLEGREPQLPSLEEMIEHAEQVLLEEWREIETSPTMRHHDGMDVALEGLTATLTNWYGHLRPTVLGYVPLRREPYFNVPYGDSRIHGYIDQINWDPEAECFVVVDDKTAGHFKYWERDGSGHEIEMAVYVEGVKHAPDLPGWGEHPVRMEWHVARRKLSNDPRFEPARLVVAQMPDWVVRQLGEELANADRIVSEGEFFKNPDWNLCAPKWCPFHLENGGPCNPFD